MSSEPWYNQPDTYGKQTEATDSSPGSAAKAVGKGALKVAGAAGRRLKKGAHIISQFAANNPWGIRLFSFISSIGLFAIAVCGLIGILGPTGAKTASFYLFNTYMLMLTMIVFIAECKDEWPGFGRLRPWVLEQFGFTQTNLGRGVYLLFIGIVWFGAWGWVWGMAGLAVIGVGLLYLAAHWRGAGIPGEAPADPQPSKTVELSKAPGKSTTKHVQLEEDPEDLA